MADRLQTSGLVSNVYYWETLEALSQLTQHPAHLVAKSDQGKWLDGYQIVISQVLRVYGDDRINSPLRHTCAAPARAESAPRPAKKIPVTTQTSRKSNGPALRG